MDYYRRILAAWGRRFPGSAPSLIIDSLDVQVALRLLTNDRPALVRYLLGSVERLERAGVHFVAITANTPHLVFDDLAARASVPLLSIVETCADEAARLGLRRLALIGTRFTMDASFYPETFARRGLEIVVPAASDRDWIHDRYINQLVKGDLREETRAEFVTLVERLRDERAVDAVILGGTELPLLLRSPIIAGVPVLDTTGLHVQAIVDRLSLASAG